MPDAVGAIIAAAIRDHPTSEPERQSQYAIAELVREGWIIAAPDAIAATLRAA
ncbi:hypothetical protein [Streptomyces sp. NPDC058394]|uniref:hypothetical protein n=1 Tax=Streptomyces sp. NPDC058394 TaxID=3346477 RepID=UPI003663D8E5